MGNSLGGEEHIAARRQEWLLSPRGQEWLTSKRVQNDIEKLIIGLEPGVASRQREELDSMRGERVWFSRYIWNGTLMHWALITHGKKYELRRVVHENAPLLEFTCTIAPWSIDQEQERALAVQLPRPHVDGYTVCLIGWTMMRSEQVDASWQQFAGYSLGWADCQNFLKLFTKQVLTQRSTDFEFFEESIKPWQKDDRDMKPAPSELLLTMSRRTPYKAHQPAPEGLPYSKHFFARSMGERYIQTMVEGQIVHKLIKKREDEQRRRRHHQQMMMTAGR